MDAQELQDYILRTHNKPMTEMGFIELHMALEELNRELIEGYYERETLRHEEEGRRLREEAADADAKLHEYLCSEQDRYDAEQGLEEIL